MSRVVEYNVTCQLTVQDLIEKVNQRVAEGWVLIGSHIVSTEPKGDLRWSQAMVKCTEEVKPQYAFPQTIENPEEGTYKQLYG